MNAPLEFEPNIEGVCVSTEHDVIGVIRDGYFIPNASRYIDGEWNSGFTADELRDVVKFMDQEVVARKS